VDSRWKISDQHSAQFQYLHSETEYPEATAVEFEQPLDSFSGDAYQLGYRYDSRDWVGWANHQRVDEGFRADSGFVPKVDRVFYEFGGGRIWHGEEDDWWTRLEWISEWNVDHDTNGQLLEREAESYLFVSGPMQSHIEVGVLLRDTRFEGVTYNETKTSFFGQVQPKGGLILRMHARLGDQVDFENGRLGDELRLSPEISWNVNRNLLVRLDASFVTLDTQDGENIFDAKVYDLRLTWQFSSRSFLRFTTQRFDVERNQSLYDDEVDARSRDVGRQLLYSYKLNPQTVFFLGYSDQFVDDDQLNDLTESDRSLFMKIGYAWTP
jgi:catechol 2,3-dioxygenase-like lactoylglutathione lyase family enzyme